jgi:AraC-like DNA-binding protein
MHSSLAILAILGGGLAPWQMQRARQLLMRDIRADCSVAKLAAACGLSRSHFSRAFKISMGVPPHRWLLHCRVQRAGEMLADTNESISNIALNCGFADQSHLTRVFHALVGSGPAAWRRQLRCSGTAAQLNLGGREYGLSALLATLEVHRERSDGIDTAPLAVAASNRLREDGI